MFFCSHKTRTSSNPWKKIAFGLLLAASAYFVFNNYIKNPEFSKTLKTNTAVGKNDAHEKSAE
jgi:hypothetical protein